MFDSILSAQQLAKPAHSEKVLGLSPEGWTERFDCLVPTTCSVVDLTLKPEGSVDTFMRRGCQGLSTDMDDSTPCPSELLSWCPTAECTSDYLPFSSSVWTSPLLPRFLHPQLNASWLPRRCAAAFLSFFCFVSNNKNGWIVLFPRPPSSPRRLPFSFHIRQLSSFIHSPFTSSLCLMLPLSHLSYPPPWMCALPLSAFKLTLPACSPSPPPSWCRILISSTMTGRNP